MQPTILDILARKEGKTAISKKEYCSHVPQQNTGTRPDPTVEVSSVRRGEF